MEQGPTIYDVADKAGVSIATISRFLNDSAKVALNTQEKIRTAIEALNYVPMGNSGSKNRRTLGRIGILTPFSHSPAFAERIQGVAQALHGTAYELIIYAVDNREQLDEYLHTIPFTKRLDGLIIISLYVGASACTRIKHTGLETVFIENPHDDFSSVVVDNVLGGELAAQHLLEKKLTPCGFIGEEPRTDAYSFQPAHLRLEGFSKALAEAGHPLDPKNILLGEFSVDAARKLARDMLGKTDRPRSIFTYGDLQAVGVLKAAKDLGLRVPEDLGVIGFDGTLTADYLELTTVSQSLQDSGRIAAETLLSRLKDSSRPMQEVLLPVQVISRSTT